MRPDSLKTRITLLASLLAGLLWLLAAGWTWTQARHEAEELFDAHLVQAASLLIAQTGMELEHEDEAWSETHAPELHRHGRRVAFQVWIDGQLRLHSANAPATHLSAVKHGLSDSVVDGEGWRVFSAWNEGRQALVQVGERSAVREEIARAVAAGLLRPLLIALPLLALAIWLAVRQGVRPLERVTGDLAQRSPENLAALDPSGLPSEARPLVERLNGLFGRVEQSLAQERRFTADAAHELRTPLAGLRAQAQVALSAGTPAARSHALEQLVQGCDRTTHLVEQLLLLARVDAAKAADFAELAPAAIARDVLGELAPTALAKDIELELQADDTLRLFGNPAWLAVLIRNLVDNAIRYSPPGSPVRVVMARDGDQLLLRVDDHGPGVADDELASLGRRFWRSLESGQPTASGSGLGLSIAQRIVALHGGRLDFARRPDGRGLSVSVRLPALPG